MMQTHDYLMPDYFPSFRCKMGACRTSCCEGWPISFSLEDYFRLTSEACSDELRRRIDTGVRLSLHPSPDAYAEIAHRWDGNCPLRLPDGRCAVHAELGDGALACVCRLYPRGVRLERGYEVSCANSCEAVVELLFARREPLAFFRREMSFDMPAPQPHLSPAAHSPREQQVRMWLISLMQERRLSLPKRLIRLGHALRDLEGALADDAGLEGLLSRPYPLETPSFDTSADHLRQGLDTMKALLALLDARSDSLRTYGEAALAYFGTDGESYARYQAADAHFAALLPEWEIHIEHLLVNHMFFERFPFQERPESLWDEFLALSAVYALLRFLGLGWLAEREDAASFVDLCAAAFRLIDHTQFDRYASRMLTGLGCTDPQKVWDLIAL